MSATLTFCGAAGGVTGSCYHLAFEDAALVIDCGVFQGGSYAEGLNHEAFPFDLRALTAVVLTHGHLDHVGRVPLLGRRGYTGPVWGHPATLDIATMVMEDSAKIAAHADGPPLYDRADVDDTRARMKKLAGYRMPHPIGPFTVELFDAGHILGSGHVRVSWTDRGTDRAILFSGDIGIAGTPILRDPTTQWDEADAVDWVVTESTYGNRRHPDRATARAKLGEVIRRALEDGGKVLIPAFAIGRTQEILYELHQLTAAGVVGSIPVIVDGPLSVTATEIYRRHKGLYDEAALELVAAGDHPLDMDSVLEARDGRASARLGAERGPAIVIAGSGMCNGGRIRGHLARHLPDPRTDVLLVGYQGARTLGRELEDGATTVFLDGGEVAVRARITRLSGFSAHADQDGLAGWHGHLPRKTGATTFITHGDDDARADYARLLADRFGAKTYVPDLKESVTLG